GEILLFGLEAVPGAFDRDQSMHDTSRLEYPGELHGLCDRNPGIAGAVYEEHRGGIAPDMIDWGCGAGPFGGGRWIFAQEDAHGLMCQASDPLQRELLQVGRAIEVDNRPDARCVVRTGHAVGRPQDRGEMATRGLPEGGDAVGVDSQLAGMATDPAHG